MQFVFSSSATVYGQPESVPVTEESSLFVLNPYGRTKVSRIGCLTSILIRNKAVIRGCLV